MLEFGDEPTLEALAMDIPGGPHTAAWGNMVVPVEFLTDPAVAALYLGTETSAVDVLMADKPSVCHPRFLLLYYDKLY